MTQTFHVCPKVLPEGRTVYDVIAGPDDETGVVVITHSIAAVADDLALLLNRLATLYGADCTDRTARELTWDLLFRLDTLAPALA